MKYSTISTRADTTVRYAERVEGYSAVELPEAVGLCGLPKRSNLIEGFKNGIHNNTVRPQRTMCSLPCTWLRLAYLELLLYRIECAGDAFVVTSTFYSSSNGTKASQLPRSSTKTTSRPASCQQFDVAHLDVLEQSQYLHEPSPSSISSQLRLFRYRKPTRSFHTTYSISTK